MTLTGKPHNVLSLKHHHLQLCTAVCKPSGEENGNPLQCSCLENSMDRGAWWAIVHRVTKSRTQLRDFSHLGNKYACLFVYTIYFFIVLKYI